MHQVIPPVAQSRNDLDVFAELSERMGFGQAYTEGRDEMQWLRHMYEPARAKAIELGYAPPDFDTFWEQGSYEFPSNRDYLEPVMLSEFRADPVANPLKTPSGKIVLFPSASRNTAMKIVRRTRPGWSRRNGSAAPKPRSSRCIFCRTSPPANFTASWTPARSAFNSNATAARC